MKRSDAVHTAGRYLAALAALACLAAGLAQAPYPWFAGTYAARVDQGTVTVQLEQQGERLSGYLEGPGVYLRLEGWVEEEGVAVGVASSPEGQLGFEALVEGDLLGLWFYEVVNGVVLPETEIEVVLTRVGAPPAAAGPSAPPVAPDSAGGGKPLQPPSSAPAAAGEASPPPKARLPGGSAPGTPTASPPPAGGPALGGAAPGPQPGSPVIATGAFAHLTQDDAAAFLEALEFVLGQIGYPYALTAGERAQFMQALAQNFPLLPQPDQAALSQARWIWERVRANWAHASPNEQQEFVVGVLALAFGEQTVRQWVGGGGRGGGGGQCTTFEDCTGAFVDGDAWLDTFNTQGCWAAAGCEGYDPSTGTFDYGGFDDY